MPFDRKKLGTTSAFQSNCGLNCLVHAIEKHYPYIDGLGGSARNNPIDGEDSLLVHFRNYYGDKTLTKAQIINMMSRLNPFEKEVVLGPVLRQMLPEIIEKYNPKDHKLMNNKNTAKEDLKYIENLGKSGVHLSGSEVQYLANFFGIKLEIYEGEDLQKPTNRMIGGRQHTDYDTPINLPAGAPTLKIWNQDNHWSYESFEEDLNELKRRNAFYSQRKIVNDRIVQKRIQQALKKTEDSKKGDINLAAIISSSEDNPGLDAWNPFANFSGISRNAPLAPLFFGIFNKISPLLGFIGGLVGGFIDILNKAKEVIEDLDIGRDLGDRDYVQHSRAGEFAQRLRQLDPEDRRDLNIQWRQNPGSETCFNALDERLELAGIIDPADQDGKKPVLFKSSSQNQGPFKLGEINDSSPKKEEPKKVEPKKKKQKVS